MVSAAYAILGLRMEEGAVIIAPDIFEPKGGLQVEELRARGQVRKRATEESSADAEPLRRKAQN